jgi:hypothetical protein
LILGYKQRNAKKATVAKVLALAPDGMVSNQSISAEMPFDPRFIINVLTLKSNAGYSCSSAPLFDFITLS